MAGTYTITLTVTDNDGLTGVANKDVQVRLPSAPVAAFTWTATGATVDVDASSTLSEAGIASYEWSWGDGSAPSMSASPTASHTYGMTASPVLARHTVSMDKSANAAPIFLAPPPPYNCLGYVTDALGSPVLNAPVTITDLNTGTVWTTTTDAEYGYYMLNLNMYYPSPVGWAVGDTIQVSATSGTLAGSATGVAGSIGNEAYLWIDVTVRGTGPVAHDFVVTLTVTDMIGQTDSVTQTVTVYY
jgi:phosphatidate phosphatase APP1